jgi:histidyl-tRNA synthetase
MRGFDYYTGIVFEVFDTNPDNNRSMLGGGRYDGLVGLFGVETLPTVGFGWGDVTLTNFLEGHDLMPRLGSVTDVYVVSIGEVDTQSQAAELRQAGVNVAIDISGRKLSSQIKTADKKSIPYCLIIGEDELKSGNLTLRNMMTGQEQKLPMSAIIKQLESK